MIILTDFTIHAGQTIRLSEEWLHFAQFLGKSRYSSNRDAGVFDAKKGNQSAWQTDYFGICAEIAFCQLCNIFPDASIRPQSGTWDCKLPDGLKVDVKQTVYQSGRLLASLKKAKYVSDDLIYALLIGKPPSFRFAGWAWAEDLLQLENIIDLGRGKCYALTQSQLIKYLPLWEDW